MIDYGLSGKVALVTGVSRSKGIGAAIATSLARSGANVFTTYYRPYDELMPWGSIYPKAEEIIARLRLLGMQAEGFEANLAAPQIPKQIFDRVEKSLGSVDILVNNAAHDQQANIYSLLHLAQKN